MELDKLLSWLLDHPEAPGAVLVWIGTKLPKIGPVIKNALRRAVDGLFKPITIELASIRRLHQDSVKEQAVQKVMLRHHLSNPDSRLLFGVNPLGHLTWAVDAVYALYPGELDGASFLNVFSNGGSEKFADAVERSLKYASHLDIYVEFYDGKKFRIKGEPISAGGEPIGVFCSLSDH